MNRKRPWPPAPSRCWDDGEDARPRDWALLVTTDPHGDYRAVRLSFVSVTPGRPGRIRGETDTPMANLILYAQGNATDPETLYGYEARYEHVYAVNLTDAQRMAWLLGRLDTSLAKLAARFGHPADWTAWVLRVVDVLKVRWLIVRDGPGRGDYNYWTATDMRWVLPRIQHGLWTDAERALPGRDVTP